MALETSNVITLCVFMVVHLCGTVWWMSKVNTTLGFIGQQIAEIMKVIAVHEATYVKATDHAKDILTLERRIDALIEKIDHPHPCANMDSFKRGK